MEILIVLAVLILFDVAAWFWGVDSRIGIENGRSIDGPQRRAI